MRIAMIGQKGVGVAGGIERHVEELSARLAAQGHEVFVYCRPQATRVRGEYRGAKIVVVPTVPQKHLDALTHSLLSLLDALRRRVDIVHLHAVGPGILAPLSRWAGTPVVTTLHGLDWQRAKWEPFAQRFLQFSARVAVRFSHRTIAVSRTQAGYLRTRHGVQAAYIPNAARLATPAPPARLQAHGLRPRGYVLFVGRLVPEKGCHYLLDAFRRLRPSLDLVVVGTSTFTDAYARRLRVDAPPGTHFFDRLPDADLAAFYTHAFVSVVPSDVEGLSLTLLEMMAHGQCVILSDIPANTEVLEGSRESAVVFRAGDVEDLVRALRWAMGHPDDVRQIGERARAHVLVQYNWDNVAEATAAVYRDLLVEERPLAQPTEQTETT